MRPGFISLLISILLLVGLQTSSVWARVDTLRAFPEKRFVSGLMDFGQYMAKNLRYPLEAMQAATVGTELVAITIAPTGELVSVAIVNPLGNAIDREVTRAVQTSRKLWLPVNPADPQDSIMLFIPITFALSDRSGEHPFYVETVKPDFILNEIVIVGYGGINFDVREDAYYSNELSVAAQKQDYKRMLKAVDELIRRNPYSDKLYLQRAKVEQELGLMNEACRDLRKITDFLGKKHLPKPFLQPCFGKPRLLK